MYIIKALDTRHKDEFKTIIALPNVTEKEKNCIPIYN